MVEIQRNYRSVIANFQYTEFLNQIFKYEFLNQMFNGNLGHVTWDVITEVVSNVLKCKRND